MIYRYLKDFLFITASLLFLCLGHYEISATVSNDTISLPVIINDSIYNQKPGTYSEKTIAVHRSDIQGSDIRKPNIELFKIVAEELEKHSDSLPKSIECLMSLENPTSQFSGTSQKIFEVIPKDLENYRIRIEPANTNRPRISIGPVEEYSWKFKFKKGERFWIEAPGFITMTTSPSMIISQGADDKTKYDEISECMKNFVESEAVKNCFYIPPGNYKITIKDSEKSIILDWQGRAQQIDSQQKHIITIEDPGKLGQSLYRIFVAYSLTGPYISRTYGYDNECTISSLKSFPEYRLNTDTIIIKEPTGWRILQIQETPQDYSFPDDSIIAFMDSKNKEDKAAFKKLKNPDYKKSNKTSKDTSLGQVALGAGLILCAVGVYKLWRSLNKKIITTLEGADFDTTVQELVDAKNDPIKSKNILDRYSSEIQERLQAAVDVQAEVSRTLAY